MSAPDQPVIPTESVRRCLDPEAIREELNRHVRWPQHGKIDHVQIARFHPRKAGRFDFEYDVTPRSADGPSETTVRLYGRLPQLKRDGDEDPTSTVASLGDRGVADLRFDLDDIGITIHSMDRDPDLPCIRQCFNADSVLQRLDVTGHDWIDRSVGWQCTSIAYRAGRRFVMRYTPVGSMSSRCGLVGKGFVDDRGLEFCERQLRLANHLRSASGDRVRVPRIVQHIPELKMTLSEWIHTSVVDGAPRSTAESWAECAAVALTAIHSSDPGDLNQCEPTQSLDAVVRWFDVIREIRPELLNQAAPLVEMIRSAAEGVSATQPVVSHGDFYESQLIVGRRTVTVLDLDMLTVADRSVDVGNYLAHQWLWCLQNGEGLDRYGDIVRVMLDVYESASRRLEESALAFEWAAALFRVGAIHAFRCHTSPHAAAVWNLVAAVLRRGRGAVLTPSVRPHNGIVPDAPPGSTGVHRRAETGGES